jgi:hypothetical protein
VPWSEGRDLESKEEIKVLKLPPGFYIPPANEQQAEQDYDPLNMKTLVRKELERRRNKSIQESVLPKVKHE